MKKLNNLYEEIISFILKEDEIDYVMIDSNEYRDSNPRYIEKKWFLEQSKRIDYDTGYGSQVINLDLKIVLKDGRWLERVEYDGSEGFIIKSKPKLPKTESDKDIDVLLHEKHICPFNETHIDRIKINGKRQDNKYQIWLEKNGKIITEYHEYVEGFYKKEHEKIT